MMALPNSILLVTLVHPDFLPPVYAVAKTLMADGYKVKIVCFNSYVSATDQGVETVTLGSYRDQNFLGRRKLDKLFAETVRTEIGSGQYFSIFSFCPYSFLIAKRQRLYHVYMALEVADFTMDTFKRSPFTAIKNRSTLKNVKRADIITTPSLQRSAWLAGRAQLDMLPLTVVNTPYYEHVHINAAALTDVLPADMLGKKKLLYTGAVNATYAVHELIDAYLSLNTDAALIITGIDDSPYSVKIKDAVKNHNCQSIVLLPFLPRTQLIALQQICDIGVCLFKSDPSSIEYQMPAPNKIGEYLMRGLHIIVSAIAAGNLSDNDIATKVTNVAELPTAITTALNKIVGVSKESIIQTVKDKYCMQIQLKPVLEALKDISHAHAK